MAEPEISSGTQPKPEQRPVGVPTYWGDADIRTVFAQQLHISHVNEHFYLTFGEAVIPLLMPEDPPPTRIETRPVARIVIPESAMPAIAEVVARNVKRVADQQEGSG